MYINEIYKNKKQNIHIIIIFLIIVIFIYLFSKYESIDTFSQQYDLPPGKALANISESNRSYSTVFTSANNTFNKSTLDSTTCWAPSAENINNNQHIKFSLSTPTMIQGVAIMGRADFVSDYVISFKVNYTATSSSAQIPVDNGIVYESKLYSFTVPDGIQISYILFSTPVTASTIFIKPQSWSRSIAMKADLLVNKPSGGSPIVNGLVIPNTTKYVLNMINGSISAPAVIPTKPSITGYISKNTDIIDALNSTYSSIQNERHINLDNQDRLNNIEKRVKKLQLDIIGLNKSTKDKINVKQPKFY
jgi:hypothetical protein